MLYLLAFFFFVMYAGDNLGLNIGFAPGLSFKNLLLYALLTGIAINAAVARNRRLEIPSVIVPFTFLIFYAVITWIAVAFILTYPDYETRGTFIKLKSTIVDTYLTFLVFFYGVTSERNAHRLLLAIVSIAIIGNVVALIDTFNIPNLGLIDARVRDGRFIGFIGAANEYGSFLVLFLPASVALYLAVRDTNRFLPAIGIFCTALAFILTGSRGAYVGLVIGSLCAAFFLRKHIPTQKLFRATATSLLVCAVLMAIAFVAGYSDVFLDRFARFEGSSHVATSGRSTVWAAAIQSMLNNPVSFVTGYGFASYESSREFYAAMHNMYLYYLYNLGIIGLALFVTMFLRLLVTARSILSNIDMRPEVRSAIVAMVFGLVGFLLTLFFGEYHGSGYLLWAYLGTVMRLAVEASRNRPVEPGV